MAEAHHFEAMAHLNAGRAELAFLSAKLALDAATTMAIGGGPALAQYWATLADAAKAMGDLETAYTLYAKGIVQCTGGPADAQHLLARKRLQVGAAGYVSCIRAQRIELHALIVCAEGRGMHA